MCVGARSDVTGSKERSTYRSWCGGIFWIPVYPLMRTDVKSDRRRTRRAEGGGGGLEDGGGGGWGGGEGERGAMGEASGQ